MFDWFKTSKKSKQRKNLDAYRRGWEWAMSEFYLNNNSLEIIACQSDFTINPERNSPFDIGACNAIGFIAVVERSLGRELDVDLEMFPIFPLGKPTPLDEVHENFS